MSVAVQIRDLNQGGSGVGRGGANERPVAVITLEEWWVMQVEEPQGLQVSQHAERPPDRPVL